MDLKMDNKRFILLALALAAGIVGGNFLMEYLGKSRNIFDKQLFEVSKQVNQNLPMMLDAETRIDTTIPMAGKTFQYVYTLVNYSRGEIDIEAFKEVMRPQIVNSIKTSTDMKTFRENQVTMVYLYRDKDGNEVAKFTILPDEYK